MTDFTPNSQDMPTLYGFPVSPNVRAARLAFAERVVTVDFREIGLDTLALAAYAAINPFRKMPALQHGALTLYETPAILTYANSLGKGASLVPADAVAQARMWQFVGIAQHYLYPKAVMELYFHRVLAQLFGLEASPAIAEAAIPAVTIQFDVLEAALQAGPYLAGNALSFADLYCGPMVDYAARTKDGAALLAARPALAAWLGRLRQRDSFRSTLPSMLAGTDQV
jgi:glutathione S-transferase